ncbi:MAG TPA: formylmethanofuran dehydrogenase [Nitrospirae bacterium]|nr:formylmethanofuran dehydrogenase [Nitrospirota bacterium]
MSKEKESELDFEGLLNESVKIHGHLCPGQVLGVRLSMLGLKLTGITDPKGKDRKKLVVYVEIDRCATDAIQSVSGCSLGKRSLKFLDFGKMAAAFVNLETGEAVRILAKEESRDKAKNYIPDIEDKYKCQLEAYKIMPDDELFEWKEVKISIPEEDMPGRPTRRIKCEKCGEFVQDNRDVGIEGKLLCKACAEGAYYEFL